MWILGKNNAFHSGSNLVNIILSIQDPVVLLACFKICFLLGTTFRICTGSPSLFCVGMRCRGVERETAALWPGVGGVFQRSFGGREALDFPGRAKGGSERFGNHHIRFIPAGVLGSGEWGFRRGARGSPIALLGDWRRIPARVTVGVARVTWGLCCRRLCGSGLPFNALDICICFFFGFVFALCLVEVFLKRVALAALCVAEDTCMCCLSVCNLCLRGD